MVRACWQGISFSLLSTSLYRLSHTLYFGWNRLKKQCRPMILRDLLTVVYPISIKKSTPTAKKPQKSHFPTESRCLPSSAEGVPLRGVKAQVCRAWKNVRHSPKSGQRSPPAQAAKTVKIHRRSVGVMKGLGNPSYIVYQKNKRKHSAFSKNNCRRGLSGP